MPKECAQGWVECGEDDPCPCHAEYWQRYRNQTPPPPEHSEPVAASPEQPLRMEDMCVCGRPFAQHAADTYKVPLACPDFREGSYWGFRDSSFKLAPSQDEAKKERELYDAYLLGCEDECIPEPKTFEKFMAMWRTGR